jgi:hypothetical protein
MQFTYPENQKQRVAGLAAKEDTQLPPDSYVELNFIPVPVTIFECFSHLFQHLNIPLSIS